jgi:hypothetical protein
MKIKNSIPMFFRKILVKLLLFFNLTQQVKGLALGVVRTKSQ